MAEAEKPKASRSQRSDLQLATRVDVRAVELTKQEAKELLGLVAAGCEGEVREALIQRGGVRVGELPDANEVLVSDKDGRDVLHLPHLLKVRKNVKVTASELRGGFLIVVTDAPNPSRANPDGN